MYCGLSVFSRSLIYGSASLSLSVCVQDGLASVAGRPREVHIPGYADGVRLRLGGVLADGSWEQLRGCPPHDRPRAGRRRPFGVAHGEY